MNKISFIICIIVACCILPKKDTDTVNNLKTFAKVYGYVKYFHPSEEAFQVDWKRFSAYGASEIIKCKNQTEIIEKLTELFKPIAPTIVFSDRMASYNNNKLIPPNKTAYRTTYWQHRGLATGMRFRDGNPYRSVRVNALNKITRFGKTTATKGAPIFDASPAFGAIIEEKIGEGIYCQIPLTLYTNDEGTYPKSETFSLLQNNLNKINADDLGIAARLGNIINVYNVFQHFHPYFKEANVNWNKELETALQRSFTDNTRSEHLITLQKFTATLKDGHIWVNGGPTGTYQPPINWQWIENKLVITNVFDDALDLNIGDVVSKINGIPVDEYFKEVKSTIAAGTEGWANYRAQKQIILGKRYTEFNIEVNSKTIKLQRNGIYNYGKTKIPIQEHLHTQLDHNIYYINLAKAPMDTITKILPKLKKSDGIICDLRGYPKGNDAFISHLLKKKDTSASWMRIPHIIYPDQKNITGYRNSGWALPTKKPYLGDKKIVFMINGRAISYAESYMGFIKNYDLATIIGQPTAGTNGNLISFHILSKYTISWTGMKVVNHDGSQLYAKGILPDIYVQKTINGIKKGEDEFLNKAIEVILNKQ
ncbi:MAG: S41 family peptidase [Bacteroidota bacterium]